MYRTPHARRLVLVLTPPYLIPVCQSPPLPQAFRASENSNISGSFDNEKALAAGGGVGGGGARRRGAQMFMLSTSADPDHKAHVAIAGTSSHLHPSDRGSMRPSSPLYRGSGSLGIVSVGGDVSKAVRSSSDSHSPFHVRKAQGGENVRRDSGGMVPAEAESSPVELEMDDPMLMAGSSTKARVDNGGGGGGGGGVRQGSSRSRRSSRSSRREGGRSSRRTARDAAGRVMRPAMPAAGPTDEMRPSPGPDDPRPPGPWVSR